MWWKQARTARRSMGRRSTSAWSRSSGNTIRTTFSGSIRTSGHERRSGVIVNVCPAAVTSASPERIWNVLTTPERFGEWLGARFVSAEPPGPIRPGQVINLRAPSLGMQWPVRMDVRDMDPQRRWIDLVVFLPFGVENHERVTLSETRDGGTLVRFN